MPTPPTAELGRFAAFILDGFIDEYVTVGLAYVKKTDLPLMKFFSHLSEEQLRETSKAGAIDFLTGLKEGKALQRAQENLRLWKEDKLPGLSKNQVHPTDLVLTYSLQRLTLLHFLDRYTQHTATVVSIIREWEDYYARVQNDALLTLFEIQRETEADLNSKNRQLEEAQAIAHIGSWEWNVKDQSLTWSKEMFRIFEKEPVEGALWRPGMADFLAEWNIQNTRTQFDAHVNMDKPFEYESLVPHKNGKDKVLLNRGQNIRDAEGNLVKVYGTSQDITDLKRAETEKELSRQKDEFMSIASHELRTPLTVIRGHLELLQIELPSENVHISKALQHVEKLNNLVLELLDVSKIQAGKMMLNLSSFDLNDLLAESIENAQLNTSTHHIVYERTYYNLNAIADRNRLEQVMSNLLENAIKYSPSANRVVVRADKNEKGITVHVEDFGIGIPENQAEHVFKRFFRVEGPLASSQGLGVGLYICNEIVQRHGGSMSVLSQAGKGSVFSFTLPVPEK